MRNAGKGVRGNVEGSGAAVSGTLIPREHEQDEGDARVEEVLAINGEGSNVISCFNNRPGTKLRIIFVKIKGFELHEKGRNT